MDVNKKILEAIRGHYEKNKGDITHRTMADELEVSAGCVCKWLEVSKYRRANGGERRVSTDSYSMIAKMLGYADVPKMLIGVLGG